MPSLINSLRYFAAAACAVTMSLPCGALSAAEVSVAQLDQLLSERKFDEATTLARVLNEQSDSTTDLTLPFARLARKLQQANELEVAAEFYQRAVIASTQPAALDLSPNKVVAVRLAAGLVLLQNNKNNTLDEAIDALRPTLSPGSGANEAQREMAVSIYLRIGAAGLAKGSAVIALEAYSIAMEHADQQLKPTAMLGAAWATAIQNTQPLEAARKLADFIDQYPDHADTSRAARACAACLEQAGRIEDSSLMQDDLLQRWPDSDAAIEVVRSKTDLAVDLVPPSVRDWLIRKAKANDLNKFDAKTTMLGMLIAAQQDERAAWANLAKRLAAVDDSGQATTQLLLSLSGSGKLADAERLATTLIAPRDSSDVTPTAREAACRWAGRTQHWSMLALASESENLEQQNLSRTVAVERLFAESLTQSGRIEDARTWWNHLIDVRGVNDFPTLLRCAESETSVGEDALQAEQRIAAARIAANKDRFNLSLVDLLDAELSIRRLRFDQARALLEHVIRSTETEASLRGRAQWLIGETYYLQRDFAQAIEAYRRVEGIDPGGGWVSPSLVQAGKSFEQLGRTRDAAVCYGNLLSRFANSPHAEIARRRLAAIAPDPNPTKVNSSQQTIRR